MTTLDERSSAAHGPTTDGRRRSYVYAVVPADARIPDELAGIDDQEVEVVRHGGIAAVVGPLTADRVLGKRLDLIAHMRVVDAMAAQCPTIPVRFGSVLGDLDEVGDEFLAPNAEFFTMVLRHLTGRRQYIVRVRYDEETVLSEIVAENPGVAELRDRTRTLPDDIGLADRVRLGELVARALEGKRELDSQAVLDQLQPYVVDVNVRAAAEPDDLVRVVALVDDRDLPDFEKAAETIAEGLAGRAGVQLLGPSAPYDFVPDA